MKAQTDYPLIITGAGGRVGRMLRRVMPAGRLIWVTRNAAQADDLAWDALMRGVPEGAVAVHLAGAVTGDLGVNQRLAQQICGLPGWRHVFIASTMAVYGPGGVALREDMPADPQNPYGQAKLAMEQAVQGAGVTLLRIGNVAGADALLGGMTPGKKAILDPVAGQKGGPVRSYIGPVTLARTLNALARIAADGKALPQVLNVAAAGGIAMADLLNATGAAWQYGETSADVVPHMVMDVTRLCKLVPVPKANAADLVAEWRAAQ